MAIPIPKSAILDQLSVGLTVASYQWSNLTLTVRDKMTGKLKKLLHGCTGTALSGDLVALMGPSGTSKRPSSYRAGSDLCPCTLTHLSCGDQQGQE